MYDGFTDYDLLRQYVETDSDAAFGVLVARHTDMVYSAARRQVGPGQTAEDVTQAAFVLLMRKADRLPEGTVIAGWLFKSTRYIALNARRAETRRRRHERKAGTMTQRLEHEHPVWRHVAPELDAAIARLTPADRSAVVLRFFERRSLAEVGTNLGVSEHAAQMRVSRAVEKLRAFFRRRGVTMNATAFAVLAGAHATQAAPPALKTALGVDALRAAASSPAGTLAAAAARSMAIRKAGRLASGLAVAAAAALMVGVAVRVAAIEWPAVRQAVTPPALPDRLQPLSLIPSRATVPVR